MINAKEEFLRYVEDMPEVKCARITYGPYYERKLITLKVGYTPEEYDQFLTELDFGYDNDYGGQELFGTIWLIDGSWFSRAEYDGSEWWAHNTLPPIPEDCY